MFKRCIRIVFDTEIKKNRVQNPFSENNISEWAHYGIDQVAVYRSTKQSQIKPVLAMLYYEKSKVIIRNILADTLTIRQWVREKDNNIFVYKTVKDINF